MGSRLQAGSGGGVETPRLDAWLQGESLEELVLGVLFEMHLEASEAETRAMASGRFVPSSSFPLRDIARRAGLPERLAQSVLERLRKRGFVGRRKAKEPRYYLSKYEFMRRSRAWLISIGEEPPYP